MEPTENELYDLLLEQLPKPVRCRAARRPVWSSCAAYLANADRCSGCT